MAVTVCYCLSLLLSVTGHTSPSLLLLLDCRNDYESDEGRFSGAEPLGTQTFAASWEALRDRLSGVDRATPILTYCTGGIRCVKVNAFLEQAS